MRKLNKMDKKIFFISTIPCLLVSYFFKDCVLLNNSDMIAFVAIATGFLLSALTILFSSPLRQVLYEKDEKGYESIWEQIVIRYSYLFNYCTGFIVVLLLNFEIPKWVLITLLMHIVILISFVANQLFMLLLREVND